MKRRSDRRRPPGGVSTHGGHLLTRALAHISIDHLDHRTKIGSALRATRDDLLADKGGRDNVSAAELALIEDAARADIITRALWDWIANKVAGDPRTQAPPVPITDATLGEALDRLRRWMLAKQTILSTVGLERRAVAVPTIRDRAGLS